MFAFLHSPTRALRQLEQHWPLLAAISSFTSRAMEATSTARSPSVRSIADTLPAWLRVVSVWLLPDAAPNAETASVRLVHHYTGRNCLRVRATTLQGSPQATACAETADFPRYRCPQARNGYIPTPRSHNASAPATPSKVRP